MQGTDEVLVKLAKCCMPVPGDPIMGFVTKGRGISVHRIDCPNAEDLLTQQDRLTAVSWDPNASGTYPVSIQLEALDRPKLLRDVTTAISDYGLNINQASSQVGGGFAKLQFTFEITNPAQLTAVINTVKKVESVYDVYRITPR